MLIDFLLFVALLALFLLVLFFIYAVICSSKEQREWQSLFTKHIFSWSLLLFDNKNNNTKNGGREFKKHAQILTSDLILSPKYNSLIGIISSDLDPIKKRYAIKILNIDKYIALKPENLLWPQKRDYIESLLRVLAITERSKYIDIERILRIKQYSSLTVPPFCELFLISNENRNRLETSDSVYAFVKYVTLLSTTSYFSAIHPSNKNSKNIQKYYYYIQYSLYRHSILKKLHFQLTVNDESLIHCFRKKAVIAVNKDQKNDQNSDEMDTKTDDSANDNDKHIDNTSVVTAMDICFIELQNPNHKLCVVRYGTHFRVLQSRTDNICALTLMQELNLRSWLNVSEMKQFFDCLLNIIYWNDTQIIENANLKKLSSFLFGQELNLKLIAHHSFSFGFGVKVVQNISVERFIKETNKIFKYMQRNYIGEAITVKCV